MHGNKVNIVSRGSDFKISLLPYKKVMGRF
jgi:hypothetical protein